MWVYPVPLQNAGPEPLSAVTGEDGRASVTTTFRGNPPERTVSFRFTGDEEFDPSEGSATVRRAERQSGPGGSGAALRPAA